MRSAEAVGSDRACIERAREVMDEITVPAGTTLIREDARSFDVYIVIEGTATISTRGRLIGYALSGDVIGATRIPGVGTKDAAVVADTTMRLLTAETGVFLSALGLPEVTRTIAKAIARAL